MEPLAVDVGEAARLTLLSPYTIRRWIHRGLLPATRVGRRGWIPIVALENLLRGQAGEPYRVYSYR